MAILMAILMMDLMGWSYDSSASLLFCYPIWPLSNKKITDWNDPNK